MVKRYLQMLLFVIVMGAVSSGILIGMDLLTRDRIAANAEYSWKTAILTHNSIEFTTDNFTTVFDESIEITNGNDIDTNAPLVLYTNKANGNISFRFYGYGLWDVLEGVLTLQPDFQTIVSVSVLKQAETPGLGGKVAERSYLDKYIGKKFDSSGSIKAVPIAASENEVDVITGATGTTSQFISVLNQTYKQYYKAFYNSDISDAIKQAMLTHVGIEFTDDNFADLFAEEFEVISEGRLTLYIGQSNNTYSYVFVAEGFYGPIETVITLDSDHVTIIDMTVTVQTEQLGSVVATRDFLDQFIGKKFSPNIKFVEEETDKEDEVQNTIPGGASTTRREFPAALNASYQEIYDVFFFQLDLEPNQKQAMLDHVDVEWDNSNYNLLFESQFTVMVKGLNALYYHSATDTFSYTFIADGAYGDIKTVITLASDHRTIVNITVTEQHEQMGQSVKSREFLDQFIGKKFDTIIKFLDEGPANGDNEVLNTILAGASTTRVEFPNALNESYAAYYAAFGWGE